MFDDPSQLPPVARVVRGGGSARDRFVANAKPKVKTAVQLAGFTLRAGFTVACFVGIVAAIGSSKPKSSSSYDLTKYRFNYTPPKFDFKMPKYDVPKFDFSQLQSYESWKRDLDQQRALALPPLSSNAAKYLPAVPAPAPKATPAPGTSRRELLLRRPR